MEQFIRKITNRLSVVYTALWLIPALLLPFLDSGLWADNVRLCYLAETITILLTALCIPVALKLFAWALDKRVNTCSTLQALKRYRCWSLLRLLLIGLPEVCGFATYAFCLSYTGLLCALICLVALLFCIPSQKNLRSHLHMEA